MNGQRLRMGYLFTLEQRIHGDVADTLAAVTEAIERINERSSDAEQVQFLEKEEGRLTLRVGVLRIFFRAACGLDREVLFVQFGHFVRDPDGTTWEHPDGEWRITSLSEYAFKLRHRGGGHLLTEAIDRILGSLEGGDADSVRIVDGFVLSGDSAGVQEEGEG